MVHRKGKLIKIYYRTSCGSSQRAISWFKKHKLNIQQQQISQITRNDLFKILQLSDEGFTDIIKHPGKSDSVVNEALDYIESLSFNEAIGFLVTHTTILKTPIILDGENHLIGYNVEEIRKFIPKEYRQQINK